MSTRSVREDSVRPSRRRWPVQMQFQFCISCRNAPTINASNTLGPDRPDDEIALNAATEIAARYKHQLELKGVITFRVSGPVRGGTDGQGRFSIARMEFVRGFGAFIGCSGRCAFVRCAARSDSTGAPSEACVVWALGCSLAHDEVVCLLRAGSKHTSTLTGDLGSWRWRTVTHWRAAGAQPRVSASAAPKIQRVATAREPTCRYNCFR